MKKSVLISLVVGSLVLITSFQNCGPGFNSESMSMANGESIDMASTNSVEDFSLGEGAEISAVSLSPGVERSYRNAIMGFYVAHLDRSWSDIGEPEIQYWLQVAYYSGLGVVEKQILASDERFVAQAYRQLLRRKGDRGGIRYYTERLRSKAMSRAQLTTEFTRICSQRLNGECQR